MGNLPTANDRRAVLAEGTSEALGEVVVALHAAGVVVVLRECADSWVRADDRDAVGELGHFDAPALDQERTSWEPFERRPAADAERRVGGEGTVDRPVADEGFQWCEREMS